MKTSLIIGSTGMVGIQLVDILLQDDAFGKVKSFSRRSIGIRHEKLEEHLVDFDAIEKWRDLLRGDVLFSTLGATIKQAGSEERQYQIDYTYQFEVAAAAAQNRVPVYVLVSSAGADPKAKIFYSRMKGELEQAVRQLPFSHIHIVQPSLLVGERTESRPGERFGKVVLDAINAIGLFRKYRPIGARTVAYALRNAAFITAEPVQVHTLDNVFELAESA